MKVLLNLRVFLANAHAVIAHHKFDAVHVGNG